MAGPGQFEREWRRRFERFAQSATAEHQVSGWSEAGLRRRVRAFQRIIETLRLPDRSRVLDLGAGAGTYVRLLAARGHRVTGADYSLPSLRRAAASDPGGAGRYVGADAYSLPFPDGTFHLVSMVGIFQALSDPGRALGEARRILRPGGFLIAEILNADEIIIRLRAMRDRARHAPPGVCTYRLPDMRRRLRGIGFEPLLASAVLLPPRNLPWIEPALDVDLLARLLRVVPGLARIVAVAFLIASRRPGDSAPAPAAG